MQVAVWVGARFGVRRHVAALKARTCPRTPNLPFPEEFRRAMNFLRKTFVHGTIERGLLQQFSVRMIGRERNMNLRRQTDDPAGCIVRHFLLHRHGQAAEIDSEVLRSNSHGSAYAGGKSCRDQIGGRERFAFALIVARRVRGDFCLRWAMRSVAMQIARVLN